MNKRILLLLISLAVSVCASFAVNADDFSTPAHVLNWVKSYQSDPEPERLPDLVQAMVQHGLLKDQKRAGLYIGFTAGVIGSHGDMALDLVKAMFPMPPKEQVIIIKAVAYSGLPQWQAILSKLVERMPARSVMIDRYLFQDGLTLMDVPLDKDPAIIDTLWGYYIATGLPGPIRRITQALRWAETGKNAGQIEIAHTAKWTLAANAERNPDLLGLYRRIVLSQPPRISKPLRDVIKAAERFNSERIKDSAQIAIAKARQSVPTSKWATAGKAGSTLLSVGCIAASALGHPEIAAPCVITGALYSGAVKLFQLGQ